MTGPIIERRVIAALLLILISAYLVLSQDNQAGQEGSQSDKKELTFKVPVDVVVVSATATDRQGNPVMDLTADDFRVYEEGKLQPIHTFALESYKTVQEGEPGETRQKMESEIPIAETPDDTRPRLISVFVDDIASTPDDRYYAMTQALNKFVEQDLGPWDQMAISSASGRVQYKFSSDRQLLLEEIASLYNKLDLVTSFRSACPILTDLQAQRISMAQPDFFSLETAIAQTMVCYPQLQPTAEDSASEAEEAREEAEHIAAAAADMQFHEMQHRNRLLLQSLRQHVRSLRHFDATKILVFLSNGFLPEELNYHLQEVIDQALRAGVVLNTMDLRGLYTGVHQASESLRDLTGAAFMATPYFQAAQDDAEAKKNTLNQLAYDTGGLFYHNSNDLHEGLQRIANRETYHYILTYASPSREADGRFRSIKLEVLRPGVELAYRRGYYAPKQELTFERRKKEDIQEALQAPGNLNEIPINFSYNCYQLDDFQYEVALLTSVRIQGLRFLEEEGRYRNLFSLVVVAFDENDRFIDGIEKSVEFNLSDSNYSALLTRGLTSKVQFKLPIGRYKVKAVVRETVQSKMGSLTKAIEIP